MTITTYCVDDSNLNGWSAAIREFSDSGMVILQIYTKEDRVYGDWWCKSVTSAKRVFAIEMQMKGLKWTKIS